MVLLRELDDAKDYPAVIHPVSSDSERQVRAHYTRADGTLNIDGYYYEMFGFTVKSSDFESGSSDSDSSGNDSCSSLGEGGENKVVIDPVAVELMFNASGNRLFPFYWSSSPRLIKGTRPGTLNEYERLAVSALSKFQKYARTSSLADLPFEDLRQVALDHHIQGVLLTYCLSNCQEHESIDFRNKMESADTSLSALEKEFAAAKSKFEEDLAAVKAEQEEKGELAEEKAKAKTQQEEASLNAEALTGRIEQLEVDGANQFDEGFKFSLEQVKVVFPDVDAVKLGELDSVNQIVERKIVPYAAPPSE
ncbi:hypothetical protein TSUD_404440 [Trifolium subterraneum]|uniref:Uncharacterized protein n=1 Tax=Trifolium subterraneum TaxID=3900 RepID=A0A2Z6PE95_TRISU|nr:hypothetical protein TSUD_404440 [Trifolium subterraneum]